ncbi:hypothetical protein EVB97_114 [Rhizobium phage RHph_Y65]|uniref:Uncharacterized protein n=1 Tax=Rhizobium phage RHph_Y65 TaxID=2509785 RepID=A0A7S5R7R6_9CAUD|nr:hypothetical protein PQC17_gp114 [Rhizobium phage RHph_Y65]QIG72672.1 hypothetical protein EVB97_114 [Rhizobium phage RHph_Y65]
MLSSVEKNIVDNYRHLYGRTYGSMPPALLTDERIWEIYDKEIGVMPTGQIQDEEVLMSMREDLNLDASRPDLGWKPIAKKTRLSRKGSSNV